VSITERVCPRCGTVPRADHKYCGNCGLDLAAQFELPSRQEWRAQHATLTTEPYSRGTPAPPSGPEDPEQSSTEQASPSHSAGASAGRKRLILAGAALVVIAVVAVAAAPGGGGGSPNGGGVGSSSASRATASTTASPSSATPSTTTSSTAGAQDATTPPMTKVTQDIATYGGSPEAECVQMNRQDSAAIAADTQATSEGILPDTGLPFAQFQCTTISGGFAAEWIVWWENVGDAWLPAARMHLQ
jgi:hypothetical protein